MASRDLPVSTAGRTLGWSAATCSNGSDAGRASGGDSLLAA